LKILSIIPARGGSKSVPRKNLILLNKKPLLDFSITASINSKLISKTVLSTDDDEIKDYGKKFSINIIRRPKNLATDDAPLDTTITHVLDFLKETENFIPDVIVLLQNTSPLRTSNHIDEALELFFKKNYDSLLSVYSSHKFIWHQLDDEVTPVNYDPMHRPNRQDFTNEFIENGAIYITKYDSFQKTHCRISGKIGYYLMPENLSFEIDSKYDIFLAEQQLNNREDN
jgi:CMP-N,N'-diacetyllegionaminic acid synthase